ncbi:MAG: hypothetical protein ABIT20_05320 [Gemmatimonadaceae bacterium]
MRPRRGFALMAAMWLVVLMGASAFELSVRSRQRRLAAANAIELVSARAAASAALETGLAWLDDDTLRADPWTLGARTTTRPIALGAARATIDIYDAASRLNLNTASEDDLRRLLNAAGVDAGDADRLAQRIMDWRDADRAPRGRGAERDAYLRNGARVLPPDAPFATIGELADVDGMSTAILARIAPSLTLAGSGQVNVNAASGLVLRSLPGIGIEAATIIERARPLRSLEDVTRKLSRGAAAAIAEAGPELAQRIIFDTREIVVSAEGWLDGSPVRSRAELLAFRTGDAMMVQHRRTLDP